jgi:hypothetical protein
MPVLPESARGGDGVVVNGSSGMGGCEVKGPRDEDPAYRFGGVPGGCGDVDGRKVSL